MAVQAVVFDLDGTLLDRRIFEVALGELQVAASAAVFVGDHPDADLGGARDCGLLAIRGRDDFWPEPEAADAVREDLRNLQGLIAPLG